QPLQQIEVHSDLPKWPAKKSWWSRRARLSFHGPHVLSCHGRIGKLCELSQAECFAPAVGIDATASEKLLGFLPAESDPATRQGVRDCLPPLPEGGADNLEKPHLVLHLNGTLDYRRKPHNGGIHVRRGQKDVP